VAFQEREGLRMDRRRFLAAVMAVTGGVLASASMGAEEKQPRYADGHLATPCGLFCGSCRLYMSGKCKGCGTGEHEGCPLYGCCRLKKKIRFCAECEEFACERLLVSGTTDRKWLEQMAKEPTPKRKEMQGEADTGGGS
jgi:hypothetical protein